MSTQNLQAIIEAAFDNRDEVNLETTGEIREFDPETTNNYELGFRSNWFGRRLGIDLNLFYTQWNDQQVQQLTENGADSFTANAAESELYGAELETRYQLASTLRGYASVGLVHTEFLDYINGRNNFTGNQFGRAPEKTASTGLEWRPTLLGSPNWLLTTSLNYTEGAFAFPENDPRQRSDSHAVWDMKAGYDAPRPAQPRLRHLPHLRSAHGLQSRRRPARAVRPATPDRLAV